MQTQTVNSLATAKTQPGHTRDEILAHPEHEPHAYHAWSVLGLHEHADEAEGALVMDLVRTYGQQVQSPWQAHVAYERAATLYALRACHRARVLAWAMVADFTLTSAQIRNHHNRNR